MEDDILHSPREMIDLLSKHNVSILKKENENYLLVQMTGKTTYVPLSDETDSLLHIFELVSELIVHLEYELAKDESE